MKYNFYSIAGALPDSGAPAAPSLALCLRNKRTYVPRGCRPHIAWVGELDGCSGAVTPLGRANRLKGDGTCAMDGESDGECASDSRTTRRGQRVYSLVKLITVDGATGRRVLWIRGGGEGSHDTPTGPHAGETATRTTATDPVPSGRRLASILQDPRRIGESGVAAFIVSDDRGGLFQLRWPAAVAQRKRGRGDGGGADHQQSGSDTATAWTKLVDAHSSLPSGVYAGAPSTPFSVSRGSPGYVGLAFSGVDPSRLFCLREGFNDLRVMDMDNGSHDSLATVVRTYATTHRPTALYVPSAWPCGDDEEDGPGTSSAVATATAGRLGPLANTVLVCEGSLATLFDIRCPSAVMRVSEFLQSAPDTSSGDAGFTGGAPEGEQGTASQKEALPLVPGRLTSTLGSVSDACATANPLEVALAIDRALCVYDLRKFSRLFSSSHVLKYAISTTATTSHGRAVVCAGVDAEVRIIPLYPKVGGGDAAGCSSLTLSGVNASAAPKPPPPRMTAAGRDTSEGSGGHCGVESVAPVSTFRTRLNTSVSCDSNWQGGWVTSINAGGGAAVGISMDHQVFLAQ